MKRQEKIDFLIKEDRVFRICERENYIYYRCKGLSGRIYEIIYHKPINTFTCDCKNIRASECYHIEAVKKLIELRLEDKDYDEEIIEG